jgi:ABC-type polysaccharide/polyol phosphate transport system ATPase subunit
MVAPIDVSGLSIAFRLPHHTTSSIKEFAIRRVKRQVHYQRLWALRDVSFSVAHGEVLGVVGAHRAGNTTFMKAVGGIVRPTAGRVVVHGRVTPILGLGAGLHPDLTGEENIIVLAALLGREPRRARARAAAIAEWAGLTDYLDVPLRTYSAGMMARLAFAVVSDERPEVLLLDEIFAVGDADFQRRSQERIAALLDGGTTVMLVSHDTATIRDLSSRVLWLAEGAVADIGEPDAILSAYDEAVAAMSPT